MGFKTGLVRLTVLCGTADSAIYPRKMTGENEKAQKSVYYSITRLKRFSAAKLLGFCLLFGYLLILSSLIAPK